MVPTVPSNLKSVRNKLPTNPGLSMAMNENSGSIENQFSSDPYNYKNIMEQLQKKPKKGG